MRNAIYNLCIVALAVFCIGAYYHYRVAEAKKIEKLNSFAALRVAPATICTFKSGDYEGNSSGALYVDGGRALYNVRIIGTGEDFEGLLHVLIQADGTHILYPETAAAIPSKIRESERMAFVDSMLLSYSWNCLPWWVPDDSVFNLPPL